MLPEVNFKRTKLFKNAKLEKWGIFGWFSNIVFSCKALVSLPNKNMVHIIQNIQILEYTLCTTVFHLRCEVLFSIKRPFFAAIFLWKCNSFANKNLLICFALEQLVQLWKKKLSPALISSEMKHTANKFAVLDREMCQSKSYKNSTK